MALACAALCFSMALFSASFMLGDWLFGSGKGHEWYMKESTPILVGYLPFIGLALGLVLLVASIILFVRL